MKNDIYVKISLIEIALQIIKHELMELVVLVPNTALLFPGVKSVVIFVLNNLR